MKMTAMEVTTNNIPRPVLHWGDLSAEEQAEFDYTGHDPHSYSFFRYRGEVYDLGEFTRIPHGIQYAGWLGWHCYQSDSYFSGLLVKIDYSEDMVIVGRYCC